MQLNTKKSITIRFYEELNDFLRKEWRKKDIVYPFFGNPTIKDVIESMGVPHTEIDLILVNGDSINFRYHIKSGDRISIYPVFELLDISNITHLRPKPLRHTKFILDVHLGKLAKKLRMLGFNSLYRNDFTDLEIIEIAKKDKRIILTHDIGILKNALVERGYWIRSSYPEKQLQEVIKKFDLYGKFQPFSLCLVCNGKLTSVSKDKIISQLSNRILNQYDVFFQCDDCKKIYWRGSHYQNMQLVLKQLNTKEN